MELILLHLAEGTGSTATNNDGSIATTDMLIKLLDLVYLLLQVQVQMQH